MARKKTPPEYGLSPYGDTMSAESRLSVLGDSSIGSDSHFEQARTEGSTRPVTLYLQAPLSLLASGTREIEVSH